MNRYIFALVFLVLGIGIGASRNLTALGQQQKVSKPAKQWEYKVHRLSFGGGDGVPKPQTELNKLGEDGWEYVGIEPRYYYAIFKRLKAE